MNFKKNAHKLKKLFLFIILIITVYTFLFKGITALSNLGQIKIIPLTTFFSISKLIKENRELKEENLKLLIENSKLKNDKAFLLDNQTPNNTLAFIILYLNTHQGQYFIINKGCKIAQSNKTIAVYDKFLVGKVIKCNDNFSKVELLTNHNFKTSVRSIKSNINGLFESVRNEYRITLKPLEKQIENDELIITSGQDGLVPAGLIVGQYKKGQDIIKLLIDLNSLKQVSLINIDVE